MRISILLPLLVIAIFSATSTNANDIPYPPDGFKWRKVEEIKAYFLLPDDWDFLEEHNDKTIGVFLSKEKITPKKIFNTGVTINAFLGSDSAPKKLRNIIESMAEKHGAKVTQSLMKPFIRLNTQYDSIRKSDGVNIRVLHIAIVNIYTRTGYLVLFESPVVLWDQSWPIGETIVNNLGLDTNI